MNTAKTTRPEITEETRKVKLIWFVSFSVHQTIVAFHSTYMHSSEISRRTREGALRVLYEPATIIIVKMHPSALAVQHFVLIKMITRQQCNGEILVFILRLGVALRSLSRDVNGDKPTHDYSF